MEFNGEIKRFAQLNSKVFEIALAPEHPLIFNAGQYVSVVVPAPNPETRELRRPYSIASAPENPWLELCVQKMELGPGSGYLSQLRPGSRLRCFGPYGHLVYRSRPEREAIFVATGTGIAPFRSILLSDAYRANPPVRARVLFGVSGQSELLYASDFSNYPGVEWIPCFSRAEKAGSDYFQGRVTAFLRANAGDISWGNTEFYLCGNGAMIDEAKSILREHAVEKGSIHQEIYFRPSA